MLNRKDPHTSVKSKNRYVYITNSRVKAGLRYLGAVCYAVPFPFCPIGNIIF